ncbi:MAG: DUF1573 domain-containing protein [Bacteroidetes bacterium]|jgi:hypothetical protein|nr:DUF1573 domain-containing protein [Bacteroidota bacterium]
MKRTFVTLLMAIGFVAFTQAQDTETVEADGSTGAKIEFEKVEHNFGKITEGTQATVTFSFTNTGNEPLVLNSVRASCGCTTPKWTREPVAPGATGEITAIYNSKGRPGNFTKTITVKYNGENGTQFLTIRGTVESAPVDAAPPVQANPK